MSLGTGGGRRKDLHVCAGLVVMLCVSDASACRIREYPDPTTAHERRITRLREQLYDLARSADTILVVRVIASVGQREDSSLPGMATDKVEVIRMLKGRVPTDSFVYYSGEIIVGCNIKPSAVDEPVVIPGREHLLYLKDGKVLRFVAKRRGRGELPMWAEISAIKEALRAK